jgi:curved DNA-binding protein CbpA
LAAAKVIEARPEQSAPARIATSTWGDTIPQNRDDALRVLGLGGSSEANQTAIKKIVDGLRMSWHPDHAEGENDRNIRELRLKQINAAWEIMSGELAKEHA